MAKKWHGRVYLGQDADGKQLIKWVGRFDTKRERDRAVAQARLELEQGGRADLPTCDAYVDRYLAEYARTHKESSYGAAKQRLSRFRKDFAGYPLDISRAEAKDWVNGEGRWSLKGPVKVSIIPAVVALYNHAIDEDDLPLAKNPFRKLSRRSKGRSEEPPPTEEEFQKLLDACSVLGEHGRTVRAMTLFAAFSLMRPSELYGLEWADIDFEEMRIHKARRVYRGHVNEPKTGPKRISLTAPARDAILGLPRDSRLVFTSKTGKRLSSSAMSVAWAKVCAKAGLDFDFYHATKHYGVHYMWTVLGMKPRAIAAQAGWSLKTVDKMLAVYGHGDVGALDEVDAAFQTVVPFRPKVVGE